MKTLFTIILLLKFITTFAADRYWVGTGNWNSTNTANWSATSGGAIGASVPTSVDDIFFDANSGNGTVTVASLVGGRNVDFTGFAGTLSGNQTINPIKGNLVISAIMTWNYTGLISFNNSSGSFTITTNGKQLKGQLSFLNATWTLLDNLTTNSPITVSRGTLNANGFDVTCYSVVSTNVYTRTINMDSGTWTVSANSQAWVTSNTGLTVNASTSTIKVISVSPSFNKLFAGGDQTYNNVWFTGTSGGYIINGSNTFNDLKDNNTSTHSINFTAATTQTVTSLTINGTNPITLQSSVSGTSWNLICTTGTITVDNVVIKDSHASGGATFIATNSVDGGGNSGWTFQ